MNPIENTMLNYYSPYYMPDASEIARSCTITNQYCFGIGRHNIGGHYGMIITDDYIYITASSTFIPSYTVDNLYLFIGSSSCGTDCNKPFDMYSMTNEFTLENPKRCYIGFKSKNGEKRRCSGYIHKGMDAFDYLYEKLGNFNIYRRSYYLVHRFCGPCGSCGIGAGYGEHWLKEGNAAFCCANHIRTGFVVREVTLPNGKRGTEFFDSDVRNSQSVIWFKMFY